MKMRDIMNLVERTEPQVSANDIFHNGSASDLRQLLRNINADPDGGAVRGLLIDGELYFWDAGLGTHNAVRGGRRGISLFLNARNVMIDDDYLRHAAPKDALQIIRANPHLQAIYGSSMRVTIRRHEDN